MDRNLALEVVRVTEMAAIAAARTMGRGDVKVSDQAAVDAMRKAFDTLNIDGTGVIGEGERDEAPMLFIDEKVGRGTSSAAPVDLALDPRWRSRPEATCPTRPTPPWTRSPSGRPRAEPSTCRARRPGT
jgi:fructose-1,6-bisphosphatase/sedoheptulose 1,7-bisphosphatase-like protein